MLGGKGRESYVSILFLQDAASDLSTPEDPAVVSHQITSPIIESA